MLVPLLHPLHLHDAYGDQHYLVYSFHEDARNHVKWRMTPPLS